MFSRMVRCVALAACFASLVGCAEVNYRGGVVAQLEDWVLFRAVTKSHRLLRSYTLAASLMQVVRSSRSIANDPAERTAIAARLQSALQLAQEAYFCLYPQRAELIQTAAATTTTNTPTTTTTTTNTATATTTPPPLPDIMNFTDIKTKALLPVTSCIFFDSRMTELDYLLYKLAAEVLVDPDSASPVATVRNQLLGVIPPVQKAVLAGTKAVEATNQAAGAVFDVTSFVNALIQVSGTSGGRWVYLLPIYRDILEFDMRLVLQVLRYQCADKFEGTCAAFEEGFRIFRNGNGNMEEWRGFIKATSGLLDVVEAHPFHFALVTRWMLNSCMTIYGGDTDQAAKILAANNNCKPLIEPTDTSKRTFKVSYGDGRTPKYPNEETLTAKRKVPSQLVQPAAPPAPTQNAAPAQAPAQMPAQNARPAPSGTTGQSATPH